MVAFNVPFLLIIMFLSAVKIRVGRMLEIMGSEPTMKSEEVISIA